MVRSVYWHTEINTAEHLNMGHSRLVPVWTVWTVSRFSWHSPLHVTAVYVTLSWLIWFLFCCCCLIFFYNLICLILSFLFVYTLHFPFKHTITVILPYFKNKFWLLLLCSFTYILFIEQPVFTPPLFSFISHSFLESSVLFFFMLNYYFLLLPSVSLHVYNIPGNLFLAFSLLIDPIGETNWS